MKKPENYIELLRRYDSAYYNVGEPEVSDQEYDAVKDEFRRYYPNHPFLQEVGAPVEAVESPHFPKVSHEIPMGSLNKVKTESEYREWAEKVCSDGLFCVSEKIDGLSVNVTYWNGLFHQAVTRGDGKVGDDISRNVRNMKIPKRLPAAINVTLRGEIFLKKSVFESKYSESKANPRNAAVGITKRLDGAGSSDLDVYFYDLVGGNTMFHVEHQKLDYLKNVLKLNTPWYKKAVFEEVVRIHEEYESGKREKLDYQIDGLVVKVDSLIQQEMLSSDEFFPEYAVAYKFESEKAETVLENVVWQVGRTGVVTPLAQIKPVSVGGVTISNVTLHNIAEIERLGVKLGGGVEVKRSGDVIPKITRALDGTGKFIQVPSNCPACDSILQNNAIQLKCVNNECTAKSVRALIWFASSLDMMNVGEKLISQLEDCGLVQQPADLYRLKHGDVSNLEGRGDLIAQKVLEEIETKREVTLDKLLTSIGIPGMSEKTAKLLVNNFHDLETIQRASEEQLKVISGIGDEKARLIVTGLKMRSGWITELLKEIKVVQPKRLSSSLTGKTFCFTGFRDDSMEQLIEANGGKMVSSVSSKLSALVVDGEKPSTKLKKAQELGVRVVTRQQLMSEISN
jgi:DNA ligase (NAD+)